MNDIIIKEMNAERKSITAKIKKTNYEKLKKCQKKSGLSASLIIDAALDDFYEKIFAKDFYETDAKESFINLISDYCQGKEIVLYKDLKRDMNFDKQIPKEIKRVLFDLGYEQKVFCAPKYGTRKSMRGFIRKNPVQKLGDEEIFI